MKLDDLKKEKELFTIPEGYFEDLPMQIQAKIGQSDRANTWAWAWGGLKLKYALPALSLALVAYFFVPKSGTNPLDINSLSTAQVEEYLLQETRLDDTEVVEYFIKSGQSLGLEDAGVNVPAEWLENEIDTEDLEDYL